jgi:hypothetical protein
MQRAAVGRGGSTERPMCLPMLCVLYIGHLIGAEISPVLVHFAC